MGNTANKAQKFLLDNNCGDLILNDVRSKNTKDRIYASDIMMKFLESERGHNADTSKGQLTIPIVLSLEEILRNAVRRQATYQVQFADYDLNTWTAPCILTQNRMDKLLDDASIRKVRLELEF